MHDLVALRYGRFSLFDDGNICLLSGSGTWISYVTLATVFPLCNMAVSDCLFMVAYFRIRHLKFSYYISNCYGHFRLSNEDSIRLLSRYGTWISCVNLRSPCFGICPSRLFFITEFVYFPDHHAHRLTVSYHTRSLCTPIWAFLSV